VLDHWIDFLERPGHSPGRDASGGADCARPIRITAAPSGSAEIWLWMQIEEEARNRGETGPELFGRRVAAINALPQTLRREMGSYEPPA
jgi:hypothetical protein